MLYVAGLMCGPRLIRPRITSNLCYCGVAAIPMITYLPSIIVSMRGSMGLAYSPVSRDCDQFICKTSLLKVGCGEDIIC